MAFLYYVCLCIFLSGIKFEANAQTLAPECSPDDMTVCVSCQQSIFCSTGVASLCSQGKVCKQQGTRAACVTPTSEPDCQCSGGPDSAVTFQCDPYNNKTFISCFNGVFKSSGNCTAADQTCNPSNGMCEPNVSPPTEMTTPTVPTCPPNPDGLPMKYNCTALFFCSDGGEPEIYSCKPGQIYSEKEKNCVQYGTESSGCSPEDDGLFPDPLDCRKYYSCFSDPKYEDGEETCQPDYHFEPVNQTCIEDSAEAPCEVETCTPCLSAGDVFPADTVCSQTYYKCVNTTYAEPGSCPPQFYFDSSNEYCVRGSCPSS